MHNSCAEVVDNLREDGCKSCVHLSTGTVDYLRGAQQVCAEADVIRRFIRGLFPQYSTGFLSKLPLYEYTFYPVSTAPITKTTNLFS